MFDMRNILFLILLIIISNEKEEISEDIYETEIIKNKFFEGYGKGKGAYYIAYSPYSSGFTSAITYIELPSSFSLNATKGKRKAFISLGIQGKYGYIDIGIMNSKGFWIPFYNDNGEIKSYEEIGNIEEAKIVGIVIELISNKKLKCSFGYREIDHSMIKYFEYRIYFSHIIEYDKEDNPIFRFYRYASLEIENGFPDNQNDNTYMINGGFFKPTLYVNGKEELWGISSDYVEACWKVSAKKIDLVFSDEKENFSIKYYNSLLNNLNINIFHFIIIAIYFL